MDNYEYIISSLPELFCGQDKSIPVQADVLINNIRKQCSERDNKLIDKLLEGFDDSHLTKEFYDSVIHSENHFIREYFRFDLMVRNAKVRYINNSLHRAPDQDIINLDFEDEDFEESTTIDSILEGKDILVKEREMDNLMWNKINEITTFNYFDIEVILAFISKLHITDRWAKLDEQRGRELFRSLAEEVSSTFKGVEYYNR